VQFRQLDCPVFSMQHVYGVYNVSNYVPNDNKDTKEVEVRQSHAYSG